MPDISICCTCYNHEHYIEKALEGMLSQKGAFTFEILVHDDASSDTSPQIIASYARHYPHIIKPILQSENQYSKGLPINETFNFSRAQGKYIALCEGDDYWTDENKLAKQFRYMEENLDCHFCFTNALVIDQKDGSTRRFLPYYSNEADIFAKPGKDFNFGEMLDLSFLPTASFFFRYADYEAHADFLKQPFPYGDLRFKLHFTSLGYAHCIDEETCVYRLNVPNSALALWSKENRPKAYARYLSAIAFLEEMNRRTEGKYSKAIERHKANYSSYALDYLYNPKQLKENGLQKSLAQKPFLKRLQILAKCYFASLQKENNA